MSYTAFAFDYDGTIATNGKVLPQTYCALQSLKEKGYHLVLVTGRIISELLEVFPEVSIFDQVVGENGALLYNPKSKKKRYLTYFASNRLIHELNSRNIAPLTSGECILSTFAIHQKKVSQILDEFNKEHHFILNGESLMILPQGITKKSGLLTYLKESQISANSVVCAGDAENDLDFFQACGYRVAVQNAIPSLKAQADFITFKREGEGICELVELFVKPQPSDEVKCPNFQIPFSRE